MRPQTLLRRLRKELEALEIALPRLQQQLATMPPDHPARGDLARTLEAKRHDYARYTDQLAAVMATLPTRARR